MPVSYIAYRGKGYLLQDETLHELRSGGDTAPIRDSRLSRRVLARGRPVAEPEALIIAYGSDEDSLQKIRERSEESLKMRNWLIALGIMVVPLMILALAVDSSFGFVAEVISLFVVMPALLFALVFVVVVILALSFLVAFALKQLGWRFST